MYKKNCLVLCFCLCVSSSVSAQQRAFNLNPLIIAIIDGSSIGIYGELVGAIYKIVRDIQAIQLGKLTEHGRVGLYIFEGQNHCLQSLIPLEQELNNSSDGERRQSLDTLLVQARLDFYNIVKPFLKQAEIAKGPMFQLINESCIKRNCPKSLLLNWAKSTDDERTAIEKTITSFELFEQFCTDLINFLNDLLYSCPKAREQFEKLKSDYIRKHKS